MKRTPSRQTSAQLEVVPTQLAQSFNYLTHGQSYPRCVWHHHPEIEIHLIHNATGRAIIGDYLGDFGHGHLVMTGPDLPHNWHSMMVDPKNGPAQKDYVIQFDMNLVKGSFSHIAEAASVIALLDASKLGLEFTGAGRDEAERIILAMEEASSLRRLILLFELLSVIATCEERKALASVSFLPDRDAASSDRVAAIISFLNRNFDRPLSQPEVAKHFDMSSVAFCRFFRRNFGRGFVRYLNATRIGEACTLLMSEKMSITEVAFNVGFNNIANFNRRFAEEKGMTPRDFRVLSRSRLGNVALEGNNSRHG